MLISIFLFFIYMKNEDGIELQLISSGIKEQLVFVQLKHLL